MNNFRLLVAVLALVISPVCFSHENNEDELEHLPSPQVHESAHGPIAVVCAELTDSYLYISNHLMSDRSQEESKQLLDLTCAGLSFVASISDREYRPVRGEELISGLGEIVRELSSLVQKTHLDISKYRSLKRVIDMYAENTPQAHSEAAIVLHHALRTRENGTELVSELFECLNTRAIQQADSMLNSFARLAEALLNQSGNRPSRSLEPETPRKEYEHSPMSRECRQASLGYHLAAEACFQIRTSLPERFFFKDAEKFLELQGELFESAALIYDHLGRAHKHLDGADKDALAEHFAHMISTLRKIEGRNHPRSVYIEKCQQMENEKAQKQFIKEVFNNSLDRSALFEELFPELEQCIVRNLTGMTNHLKRATSDAFCNSLWVTHSEQ